MHTKKCFRHLKRIFLGFIDFAGASKLLVIVDAGGIAMMLWDKSGIFGCRWKIEIVEAFCEVIRN